MVNLSTKTNVMIPIFTDTVNDNVQKAAPTTVFSQQLLVNPPSAD
ncbi:MAG: hypothetical protein NTX52_08535 [Planctomycetota bacterium]|nr:hypothetical protein [Planctomycetota bacterium]